MKRFACLLAVLLAGCVGLRQGGGENAPDAKPSMLQSEIDAITARCHKEYEADARIDPIRSKIPYGDIRRATAAQRADASRANEAEQTAIAALDELSTTCMSQLNALYVRHLAPQRLAPLAIWQRQVRQTAVVLYRGEITFGEYITRAESAFLRLLTDDTAAASAPPVGASSPAIRAADCQTFGSTTHCVRW